MGKRTKRRGRRAQNPQRSLAGSGITRARLRVPSYVVQLQTGVGNGALAGNLGFLPTSSAAYAWLCPLTIGGRFLQMAQQFRQYRVRRLGIRYRTALGSDGALPSGAVASTLASVNQNICFGFTADPGFAPVDYENAVETGGSIATNVRSNASLVVRPDWSISQGWRYVEYEPSPTIAALREVCFGSLFAFFAIAAAATVTNDLGDIIFEIDAEFRWPADNQIGPPPLSLAPTSYEQKLRASVRPIPPFQVSEDDNKAVIDPDEWESASNAAAALGKTGLPIVPGALVRSAQTRAPLVWRKKIGG